MSDLVPSRTRPVLRVVPAATLTPAHQSWREKCAGCEAELRIHEAAALAKVPGGFAPVCFPCRDANRKPRSA